MDCSIILLSKDHDLFPTSFSSLYADMAATATSEKLAGAFLMFSGINRAIN